MISANESGEFKIETLLREEFLQQLIEKECSKNFNHLVHKEQNCMKFEKLTYNGWWADASFVINYKKDSPQLLIFNFESNIVINKAVIAVIVAINLFATILIFPKTGTPALLIGALLLDLYFYRLLQKTSFEIKMFANNLANIITKNSKVNDNTPFVLNLTRKLEEIQVLKNQGVISESEYNRLRDEITKSAS